MRGFLAIFSVVVGLCAFSCVPRTDEEVSLPARQDGRVHITYWDMPHWRGLFGDVLDQEQPYDVWAHRKVREFEALHPEVKIHYLLIPWQDEKIKLELALAAGSPPDVAYRNARELSRLAARGVLEPIDAFLTEADLQDIPEAVWRRVTVAGRKYGWPWYMSTTALAVNVDLFRRAGALDLLPDSSGAWTVEEFLRAAQAVTRDTNGDGQTDVWALALFGVDNPYLYDAWLAGRGILSKFDAEEKRCTLETEAALEVLQFLRRLIFEYGVVVPGAAGLHYTEAYSLFLQQKVAMFPGGQWLVAAIPAQVPRPFAYRFVQFPHWPGYRSYSTAVLASYVVFKQKHPEKRRWAMRFARFLTNTRNSIAVTGNSTFPVRKSCGDPYYGDPRFDVYRHYMRFSLLEPRLPHRQEIEELLRPLYQSVFSPEGDPRQALHRYVEQVNEILQAERLGRAREAP